MFQTGLPKRDSKKAMCCSLSPGSTAALTTIEYEQGAIGDLKEAIERLAPEGEYYRHNERWGDGNGHAHVRAALLGPSLSVPVIQKRLALGTWQQIVFIDFDNRPRERRILVQLTGNEETTSDEEAFDSWIKRRCHSHQKWAC